MATYSPTDATELATAFSSATSGDVIDLVANTISSFTGQHTLADGVRLTGTAGSAKIQITDTGSGYRTITMGAGAIVENIIFEHPNAPDAGTLGSFGTINSPATPPDFRGGNTHTLGVDYVNHTTIRSTAADVIVRNTAFLGYVNFFIQFVSAPDALVENCLLQGAHWALVLQNSCDRFHMKGSIIAFTNGEGLKTVHGEEVPADGPVDMILEDNWFIRCARDGTDYAGGCRGLEWRDANRFFLCGNGTDYKSLWQSDAQVANDGSLDASAREVTHSAGALLHFIDCGVPQVFTTLDENEVITWSATPGNQRYFGKWSPRDIDLPDVIYEDSGNGRINYASGQSRVCFIKGGDAITLKSLSMRGIPVPNQGDVDIFDEDFDVGGPAEDDAPSGYVRATAPTVLGTTSFDSATPGLALPTYDQSGGEPEPEPEAASSGRVRCTFTAYGATPVAAFGAWGAVAKTVDATPVTSLAANMPAGITAGQMLVAFVSADDGPTLTGSTGWTKLFQNHQFNSVTGAVFYRIATGGANDAFTVTSSGPQEMVVIVSRSVNVSNISASHGSNLNRNPPSHTPVSNGKVWLAGLATDSSNAITAGPALYSNFISGGGNVGSSCQVAGASRTVNSASEDPSAFTGGGTEQNVCWTVALW